MEVLHERHMRPDLAGIAPAMRLGFDTARPPIPLEQGLDKTQTHVKAVR
jgi:hypothetical protein